ncbi:hypothetical protein [Azospirillum canadense]|uniref:hypothetical protein n=1 Tax=Azospirillum canadense TaxID=403962 RepID=UPI0022265B57|nr:hypothetical protein [Azospirillum canadense]MCW2237260.1 uncharacterized protein YlxW (UPF0749 family) [Azospirillum canadense]
MDGLSSGWLSAVSFVALLAGVTISVVVLAAVGSIRRSLNEGTARQSQQVRKLAETVATLNAQQRDAEARIQQLTDANRKLTEEMVALRERLGDAESLPRATGTARILH